jgi:thioredoxin 1
MRFRQLIPPVLFFASLWPAQSWAQSAAQFPPFDQWKAAVLARDAATLQSLYSSSPAAQINTTSGKVDADADIAFWTGLKAKRIDLNLAESGSPQPGTWSIAFQAKITTAPAGHTVHVVVEQFWLEQGGIWRLVAAKRDVTKLEQPVSLDAKIYPAGVDAREELRFALARASKSRKHVLLVFGADWCYDCHVLEKAFHRPDIAAVLTPNYEVVKVDIGQGDKNQDLMNQYEVPMKRGVPAIAVLDSSGRLLYSQKNGEFERARALGPEDLLAFLKRWKPLAR